MLRAVVVTIKRLFKCIALFFLEYAILMLIQNYSKGTPTRIKKYKKRIAYQEFTLFAYQVMTETAGFVVGEIT